MNVKRLPWIQGYKPTNLADAIGFKFKEDYSK